MFNSVFLFRRLNVHYVVQYKGNTPIDIPTAAECSKQSAAILQHWLLEKLSNSQLLHFTSRYSTSISIV